MLLERSFLRLERTFSKFVYLKIMFGDLSPNVSYIIIVRNCNGILLIYWKQLFER